MRRNGIEWELLISMCGKECEEMKDSGKERNRMKESGKEWYLYLGVKSQEVRAYYLPTKGIGP